MATAKISLVNTLTIQQRKVFLDYAKECAERHSSQLSNFRTLLRYRDKVYQRQLNTTAEHIQAVRANLAGNAKKVQDLTVPIVMPQVESAVAYQAGVYLTSSPIFGVVAPKDQMAQAMQFETAIGDQANRYGWSRELIKIFRDGYKYNFGAAVALWKKTPLKRVVTRTTADSTAGMAALEGYNYSGNCIQRVDPYNCFLDMTVAPADLHSKGEFFGWNEVMSRVQLRQLVASLDSDKTTQAKEAYESQFPGSTTSGDSATRYHTPQVNPYLDIGVNNMLSANWGAWAGLVNGRDSNIAYKSHYVVSHFMCRAMPSDFGANGHGVKIYYGIIINWQVVLFTEEMTVAHDMLPAFIMQPAEDGLGYQTQSMLDNAAPFQDMSSALWASSLESKRRQVFDRLLYNPKYIDKKDIDPASAVARIPIRNAAMADRETNPFQRAIYQIPFRDDNTASSLQMSEMISGMADQASGQNKVDQGQFQKGNKTKAEFDTTMGNSNSRQQLASICIEHQFMTPVKEVIKSNTLQYQASGTILNRTTREAVNVDPVALRKSMLEFKMTDGLLPSSKMMNSDMLMVFMQTAQALPAVATEYDVMGMFIYWAQLQGATWLEDFKRNPEAQQQFLSTLQQTTAATTPPQAPVQGAPAGV